MAGYVIFIYVSIIGTSIGWICYIYIRFDRWNVYWLDMLYLYTFRSLDRLLAGYVIFIYVLIVGTSIGWICYIYIRFDRRNVYWLDMLYLYVSIVGTSIGWIYVDPSSTSPQRTFIQSCRRSISWSLYSERGAGPLHCHSFNYIIIDYQVPRALL